MTDVLINTTNIRRAAFRSLNILTLTDRTDDDIERVLANLKEIITSAQEIEREMV